MPELRYHMPTRVVSGVDCLNRLGDELPPLPRGCLLVTGQRSARLAGHLERVQALLQQSNFDVAVFDRIEPNPTVATIEEGAAFARQNRCGWVLGLGGGSALDAAKAIALMAINQGAVQDFFKGLRPENPPLPVVAIPTTSGTGSEVTPYAVITDVTAGDKFGIGMPELFPLLTVLDPGLTAGMPEAVTVDTGLDALSHAVEALFSAKRSAFSDLFARGALERIETGLAEVRNNPNDLEARSQMQLAACLAGAAIASTATLVPHALGYPLTVRYNLPHGRATALLLPAFLLKMWEQEPNRVGFIGKALGDEMNAPQAMRDFMESLGVAPRLRAYGVQEKDLEQFVLQSTNKRHLEHTPGDWSAADLMDLYHQSL